VTWTWFTPKAFDRLIEELAAFDKRVEVRLGALQVEKSRLTRQCLNLGFELRQSVRVFSSFGIGGNTSTGGFARIELAGPMTGCSNCR
jgi:hypothetical protein